MATLSGGQASVIAGGTSSFGQFRLTTFVDSTPKPPRTTIASPVSRTTSSDETTEPASLNVENGSALSSSRTLEVFSSTLQPSPQAFVSTPPSSAAATAPPTEAAPTSHNGFGILDLAPPPPREGKLGPHRDGRVRNPVPLKLKGKTDDKNGNFAVMHMDMSGTGGAHDLPRSEAAQRTSENTAHAAKTANKDGYIPPTKRRRIEATRNTQSTQDVPLPQSTTFFPPPPQQEVVHRTRVLTAEETKYEQARLLTLLRSITPLTVVDQICKALAFFGGIPGAPPPADGSFPESADANGSGRLFVGWLSEIFPELERKGWRPEVLKAREVNRGSRPRGRPKGSKASKVRKDKGIKKGPKYLKGETRGLAAPALPRLKSAQGSGADINNPEEEWVDVGEGDLQPEKDGSQRLVVPVPEESGQGNLPRVGQHGSVATLSSSVDMEILDSGNNGQMEHQSFGTPSLEYSPATTNSGKRRPGRPKGSRNRPKNLELEGSPTVASVTPDNQHLLQVGSDSATPGSKRPQGRPSGSGATVMQNDAHDADQTTTSMPVTKARLSNAQQSQLASVKRRPGQVSKEIAPMSMAPTQLSGLSAEEQAVLEAFRTARAAQTANKATATGEKGKRPRPKSGAGVANDSSPAAPAIVPSSTVDIVPVAGGKVATQGVATPQPVHKDSGPILPPKRQRKPKDANATPVKKTTQKTDTSNSAPALSMVLKSTTVSSDPIVPAAMSNIRPPAQGLEAHYERFASLQHQGDQQQQHHQQQPQQTRRDLNAVTRSSPMQTTATYYQQPRHVPSSYGQQYPSHQPSNPYQPALLPQNDAFRNTNQQQQHNAFSPRQQQQQQANHHFSHFPDSSFIDVPALESVANGTANVAAYGQSISRSASNSSFGAGAQMGNGFESMSDNDIRERLLRGIGRR